MYNNFVNKKAAKQKSGGLGYLLLGAGVAAWWLSKDENRTKFEGWMTQAKKKLNGETSPSNDTFPVHKAGNPYPDDIGDNKMVDEGAQFAVDYYNKKEQ
ncbi:hypothetical protein BTO30_13870 [Domibacillus antri]|uniref:Uncharacterized protein n=1 Tax=Domibacillus antri TaxID=1714264 RepID=A0A1Q8Q2L3_9BACI|nr:hypothetical protein [Domibacillus antri]OLN21570.1 hypothetical protein BTO30_13870 [Domibacillus antri]